MNSLSQLSLKPLVKIARTNSAINTVSTLNAATLGGEIGKRAVENNYLYAFEENIKWNYKYLI
ncbi:VENN motif pre-toxin domain-containing protein [Avibacterium avium]|uniref:VENN motif pre-toxin domain-containing protein n=1 Tax=Avibacterium avium TaxID=751 RepID=UPI003BF7D9C0